MDDDALQINPIDPIVTDHERNFGDIELPLKNNRNKNSDEVIKESTAYRNVALNCAPYSVANDDFETLAGWLVSKSAL